MSYKIIVEIGEKSEKIIEKKQLNMNLIKLYLIPFLRSFFKERLLS